MGERSLEERLSTGEAFADLTFWRKTSVTGADAFLWLNDLVSADISGLRPGQATRALLLSPTGSVRAEFTVAVRREDVLLLQDPSQHEPIAGLLGRYVLSSDVALDDRTEDIALFTFPGVSDPTRIGAGVDASVPSCLGAGLDLPAPMGEHDRLLGEFQQTFTLAGREHVEAWRIRAGIPRFGVDGTADDLPQECGFEESVAFAKGYYLGQEAMAKIKNLGHPRRVLVHLEAAGPVSPGQPVLVEGKDVGHVTSAARADGVTRVLAKVSWHARSGSFETDLGGELRPVSS
jgi:tRNA-modifying protein YgfZ